jgi:hypothetical protein
MNNQHAYEPNRAQHGPTEHRTYLHVALESSRLLPFSLALSARLILACVGPECVQTSVLLYISHSTGINGALDLAILIFLFRSSTLLLVRVRKL